MIIKKCEKMKNKKGYLMIFILILYYCCVLSSFNPLSNEQNDKIDRNTITYFSASDSHAFGWSRIWGGIYTHKGYGVAVDSLDNVYIAGSTNIFGEADPDMILVKYDSSGEEQWSRTWEGIVTIYDYGAAWGYGVAIDSSDNVYLVGKTYNHEMGDYDMVLVKYNSSGAEQWNCTWDGGNNEAGYGVAVDSLNNSYLVGYTDSFGAGDSDMVLVKYNSDGVEQSSTIWGGSGEDVGNGVAVDALNNVYLVGNTDSFGAGDSDMVLVKYDSSGGEQWYRTWGWIEKDMGQGVAVDSSENVYLAGSTNYFEANLTDMVLVKYNSDGVEQWSHIWGGSKEDEGYGVAVDSLNNSYLVGYTESLGAGKYDMVVVKYDNSGVPQWNHTWGGEGYDQCRGIAVDSLDNHYLAGWISGITGGNPHMVLVQHLKVPEIEIISPGQNELFASDPPSFNISVLEPDLHSMWYTIDGGYTNIYFENFTGIIDQGEWDKKEYSGVVTIKFYAKDMEARVGVAEVSVEKDITEPRINIRSPSQNREFVDQVPYYSITIEEPNLDSIWYTIDGGVNNYTITPPQGWESDRETHGDTINQEAWDAALYGTITIRIYANDTMGNIGHSEVDVEKVKPKPSRIPGYNLFFLLGILSLVSILISKKIKKD